ncbi:MAG: hypothetical protein O2912_06785 [Proteobacteria bacterium]|nr:hypothetical protein [Pseudomonadota bacterium]
MMNFRAITRGLVCALFFTAPAFAGATISISEKAQLQASMQTHIDRNLVNGAYLYVKMETGDVQELHPVTAHPMILQMGKYFVLCSDFQDKKGKAVNIDFYLARRGGSFTVFQALVDDREQLRRLMKAGKVSRLK